jgi:phage terminase small subunit
VTDFLKLAKSLRLTEKQRRFAEALAADPERNQTKAAVEAGYPEGAARARGAENVTKRNVQEYLAALASKAIRKANGNAENAVGTLAEHLTILTAQARMREPWRVTRRAEDGSVLEFEPGKAASKMVDHYDALKVADNPGNRTLILNLMGGRPQEDLRDMALGLLGNGNGNGHGPTD